MRAEQRGKPLYVKARKAVVLTCGGFENNQEMIRNYLPGLPYCYTSGSPYNDGDGIRMAQAVGADLWHMNNYAGPSMALKVPEYKSPFSMTPLHHSHEQPGGMIVVGPDANRFCNEKLHTRHGKIKRHGQWAPMPVPCPMFMVFDHARVQLPVRCTTRRVRAAGDASSSATSGAATTAPSSSAAGSNAPKRSPSWPRRSASMPAALEASVLRWNHLCETRQGRRFRPQEDAAPVRQAALLRDRALALDAQHAGRTAATPGARRSTRASARSCWSAPPPAPGAASSGCSRRSTARPDACRTTAATRASTTRRCTSRWASTRLGETMRRPAWRPIAIRREARSPPGCPPGRLRRGRRPELRGQQLPAGSARRPSGCAAVATRCRAARRLDDDPGLHRARHPAGRPDRGARRHQPRGRWSRPALGGHGGRVLGDRRRRPVSPPGDLSVRRSAAATCSAAPAGARRRPSPTRRSSASVPARPRHPHAHDDAGVAHALLARLAAVGRHRSVALQLRHHPQLRGVPCRAQRGAGQRREPHPAAPRSCRRPRVNGLDITTVVDRGYQRRHAHAHRRLRPGRRRPASCGTGCPRPRRCGPASSGASAATATSRSTGDAAHTTGPGANVSLLFTSGGAPLDVATGARDPCAAGTARRTASWHRHRPAGDPEGHLAVLAHRHRPARRRRPGLGVSATAIGQPVGRDGRPDLAERLGHGQPRRRGRLPDRVRPGHPGRRCRRPTSSWPAASTVVRGTGLPPGDAARLEVLPAGALAWSPAGEATASAAGTVEVPVTATTTADYRVVSGLTASAPGPRHRGGRAAAGGRPHRDTERARPGHRRLDTAGRHRWCPAHRYVVKVAGQEQVLPPTATSVEFSRVIAGTRDVTVRAVNAVARSPWSTTSVAVPAYPTIAGPHKARKGTRVTLTMTGLLPGGGAVVTIDPAKGKTVTRRPAVSSGGTATVRLEVRSRTKVVVVSGGVRSAAHLIRLR